MTIFRHVGSSHKVKLITTIYVICQLISKYNYKYILVTKKREECLNSQIFKTVTINFAHFDFFQEH